ncbi:MAG TPA: PEGA domain-containing protein, partial [Polyangiaceae bacterium]
MIRRFFALMLIFAAALLVGPRAAHAQTEAELARAVELKTQGDALVHALHYREALVAYDAAFQISHDPAILYNRGRALDALGETPQALDALEEFIRVAPASLKGRVPKLDELVASVRARVATVVVHCPVEGASVFVRRRLEGTTPLVAPLRVPTGAARVEVQAAGYQPYLVEMNLDGGAPTIVDVALVP